MVQYYSNYVFFPSPIQLSFKRYAVLLRQWGYSLCSFVLLRNRSNVNLPKVLHWALISYTHSRFNRVMIHTRFLPSNPAISRHSSSFEASARRQRWDGVWWLPECFCTQLWWRSNAHGTTRTLCSSAALPKFMLGNVFL